MPRRNQDRSELFENVELVFRNFQGLPGKYNKAGDRNFCFFLKPDDAVRLGDAGWNVKILKAREEGDVPRPYLRVNVNFGGRPPLVKMITDPKVDPPALGEDEVGILDLVDIETVDVIINPYDYVNDEGEDKISAYLKTLFVKIYQDPLQLKYAQILDNRDN